MKIENYETVKRLMKELESVDRLLEKFEDNNLAVGIGYNNPCSGYFHRIDADMDSVNKLSKAAGDYVYECRVILSDQKRELIKQIESL